MGTISIHIPCSSLQLCPEPRTEREHVPHVQKMFSTNSTKAFHLNIESDRYIQYYTKRTKQ